MSDSQAPSSASASPNSPVLDLRHMTSTPALVTPSRDGARLSPPVQHLASASPQLHAHKLGSHSPASIPSSPTSVHSSSSAIFERDIEPLASSVSTSLLAHPSNPHRTARAKATEQLDQSVPTVLDSAVDALTASSTNDEDFISVVTPAPATGLHSGIASPLVSSRSPSPTHGSRTSTLLNLPSPTSSVPLPLSHSASLSPLRPSIQPSYSSGPVLPGAFPSSNSGSATTVTAFDDSLVTPTSTLAPTQGISHPPSPNHTATKRLSFMSYTDLLTSTPLSTFPLSSFTSSPEPPPHIPSVSGYSQAHAHHSAAASIHGDVEGLGNYVGGEWEREGLGRGLEERLEALMTVGAGKA